jgi:Rieske Fe-S protein
MDLTRREFAQAAGSLVLLTMCGCGRRGQEQPATRTNIATQPTSAPANTIAGGPPDRGTFEISEDSEATQTAFPIGPPSRYRTPGVYADYRDKWVWLVSDGQKLIALSAICTHRQCPVWWHADEKVFICPCHKSHYTPQGINQPDAKAKRPLERCTLRLIDTPTGTQIEADPAHRFRKDDKVDQFGEPSASLALG